MVAINGMTIARSTNFGREAYRVLWYLTARLEFISFTVVNTGEISIDLDMKSQAVSRALRALTRGGIIERGPRVGQKNSFRFSRQVSATDYMPNGSPSDSPAKRPRRIEDRDTIAELRRSNLMPRSD